MENNLLLILSLLFAVSMLAMLSKKLRISYPIFLVIAGLIISLIPNIPHIKLDPNLVYIIFLPPLLYAAAWNTSWSEFWRFRRAISLLAFGLVICTSVIIAFTAHMMIPGFTLALGFLLGGIISPPDAIAATSVLQDLKVPKRVVTILEGESLVNDASSLIVVSFALAAVKTGEFIAWKAAWDFVVVVVMGIIVGLGIAHIVYAIHRFLPTTPSIDTAISFISPYLMYITAEHFHGSGVLAVVSGGLFLSFRSHEVFSYSSRMQTVSVWGTLVFLLNGIVFILIGLQLPQVIEDMWDYSLADAIMYAVIISLVTIAVRLFWVFPGTYLPRILSKKIRTKEERPSWKSVFIVGWSGMRGVVSLASAIAVPLVTDDGRQFPHRNLILFITFIAILITLVLQGLSLPWLIRLFKIETHDNEEEDEQNINISLANAAIGYIDKTCGEKAESVEAFKNLRSRYVHVIEAANERLNAEEAEERPRAAAFINFRKLLLELIQVRRNELKYMMKNNLFPDELIRSKEEELDLEEARLRK